MIVVDSSAWIDFFANRRTAAAEMVARATLDCDVVVGDLILVEVLQGLRSERELQHVRRALGMFPQKNLCDFTIAVAAADNYRRLRKIGITVRGTIDVVIATWCIANDAAIIHNDRDMTAMEEHLGLVSYA